MSYARSLLYTPSNIIYKDPKFLRPRFWDPVRNITRSKQGIPWSQSMMIPALTTAKTLHDAVSLPKAAYGRHQRLQVNTLVASGM